VTGNPSNYNGESDDFLELIKALHDAFSRYAGDRGYMEVSADVEWGGDYNPKRHRTTTLGPLQLAALRKAVTDAMAVMNASAKTYTKMPPKTIGAQIRALQGNKFGRDAWSQAGLSPSPRTVARWLAGTQKPSKANREKLERATLTNHYNARGRAASRAGKAYERAAEALNDSLRGCYEAEIRLFNVLYLEFGENR
jgi:hypothetical protein